MDLAIATDYRGEFRKTEDIEACLTMKQNLQNSQKSANYPYLVQKG